MNIYQVIVNGRTFTTRASRSSVAVKNIIDYAKVSPREPLSISARFVRKITYTYAPAFLCERPNGSQHWQRIENMSDAGFARFATKKEAESAGEAWITATGYKVGMKHTEFGEFTIASPFAKAYPVENEVNK